MRRHAAGRPRAAPPATATRHAPSGWQTVGRAGPVQGAAPEQGWQQACCARCVPAGRGAGVPASAWHTGPATPRVGHGARAPQAERHLPACVGRHPTVPPPHPSSMSAITQAYSSKPSGNCSATRRAPACRMRHTVCAGGGAPRAGQGRLGRRQGAAGPRLPATACRRRRPAPGPSEWAGREPQCARGRLLTRARSTLASAE